MSFANGASKVDKCFSFTMINVCSHIARLCSTIKQKFSVPLHLCSLWCFVEHHKAHFSLLVADCFFVCLFFKEGETICNFKFPQKIALDQHTQKHKLFCISCCRSAAKFVNKWSNHFLPAVSFLSFVVWGFRMHSDAAH